MKKLIIFAIVIASSLIHAGYMNCDAGTILNRGGSMNKGKDEFVSGKAIPGTRVNLGNLNAEEKELVSIALQKAKERGVNVQRPSISMRKIGDEIFIDIIDPAKLPPPGVLGGGAVRVIFKKSVEGYVVENVGILE